MALKTVTIDDSTSQTRAAPEWYSPRFYALDFDLCPPSIGNLDPTVTFNGTSQTPLWRWKGKDAGSPWPAWGYGESLVLLQGTPEYNAGSCLLGAEDGSVKLPGTGNVHYRPAGTSLGNIGTKDLLLEFLLETTNYTTDCVINKEDWPTATTGWMFAIGGTGAVTVTVKKAGVGAGYANFSTSGLPAGLYHIAILWNRSRSFENGGGEILVNGVASATAHEQELTDFSVSLDGSANMQVGTQYATSMCYSYIHYMAGWAYDAWFNDADTTKLEWKAWAKDRFAQLTATKALVSMGSALPTTCSRNSVGYLDKVENGVSRFYLVGANWPRVCTRKDAATGDVKRGLLLERAAQNRQTGSENFSAAYGQWTIIRSTVPTTSVSCPDGLTRTTNTLHENTGVGTTHYVSSSSVYPVVNGTPYVISCFLKAAGRRYGAIQGYGNLFWPRAIVDLYTGEVTETLQTSYAGCIPFAGGWYRCWCSWIEAHELPMSGMAVGAANGGTDADRNYTGTDIDSIYMFGAQHEIGLYPSSYVPTAGAAVNRVADSLVYNVADGNWNSAGGTIGCEVLMTPVDPGGYPAYLTLSDGTDNNRIVLWSHWIGGEDVNVMAKSGGVDQASIAGTSTMWDGDSHTLQAVCRYNEARLIVDGVQEGATDTSVNVPLVSQLDVMKYYSGYELGDGSLISKVRIE